MATENEQAILDAIEFEGEDIDIDNLEKSWEEKLEEKLEEKFDDLDFLKDEHEHINNPDHLGETVMNVVWEQFMNQVATTAGEDFIKENGDLKLNLSNEAHILTPENFEHGKMPTHNPNKDTYQQRHDEYRSDFQTDPNVGKADKYNRYNEDTKVWEKWDPRSGTWKKKLAPGARDKFDTRTQDQKGSAAVAKDHTISAAEQIRDTEAAAYVDRETRKEFAKSDANLNDLDSRANGSKNDSTMDEWLNSEKDGKKPSERFDINEDELREQDAKAREEYEKMKEEGKKKTIEEGRKSQKEEFYRIGKHALRTALMSLLAALLKEVIGKLVLWLKSADKNLKSLIESVKTAIKSFIAKLKQLLINTTDSVLTTIATSIIGPVIGTIKKTITLLKQGWKSLKEAIQFLRKPENKGKPLSYLLPQVGIIVVTGLSGIGAIVLGEFIEKALLNVPFLAIEIPLLGSPANLIGMLMGAIVCGVIGAIAINLINKYVANKQKSDNISAQIEKEIEIFEIEKELFDVKKEKLEKTYEEASKSVAERHQAAGKALRDIAESVTDSSVTEKQDINNDELDKLLH